MRGRGSGWGAVLLVAVACGGTVTGNHDPTASGGGAGADSGGTSDGGSGGSGGGAGSGGTGTGGSGDGAGTGGAAGVGGANACAVSVSAGTLHTCALDAEGRLLCWGSNTFGQVGDGTNSYSQSAPLRVTQLGSGVRLVAAGVSHTCALAGDGRLWCWGHNEYGQMGNGTTGYSQLSPVEVKGIASVAQLAAGGEYACAIDGEASLWCWGQNYDGLVGDGKRGTLQTTPAQVTALGKGVVQVVLGDWHVCARKSDGTLWCWGSNPDGQVGDGTATTLMLAPVQVTDLGDSVVEVAAGGNHTCARKADGTLWCWGRNQYGQIGDGTMAFERRAPVQVTALGTRVVHVAAGGSHTCALEVDGTAWCWGDSVFGQCGETTYFQNPSPVQVTSLGTSAVQLVTGGRHSCARTKDGLLRCWGSNGYGQLGDGTFTDGGGCGAPPEDCHRSPVTVALTCP